MGTFLRRHLRPTISAHEPHPRIEPVRSEATKFTYQLYSRIKSARSLTLSPQVPSPAAGPRGRAGVHRDGQGVQRAGAAVHGEGSLMPSSHAMCPNAAMGGEQDDGCTISDDCTSDDYISDGWRA